MDGPEVLGYRLGPGHDGVFLLLLATPIRHRPLHAGDPIFSFEKNGWPGFLAKKLGTGP